ncbi:MAG: hypothetical protein QXU97_03470 [Fervidicoccaceae archaeon]
MSYLEELREKISGELAARGMKLMPRGSTLRIIKEDSVLMELTDRGDFVEINYKGRMYRYDKWYTKPKHLADVILGQLSSGSSSERA